MPRILRIINRLNLGGPTFNAALLTRYLSPEYETLLVAGSKQDSEESSSFILENLGVSYTELPELRRSLNPWFDVQAFHHLIRIIRDFKPDIVHTHAAKAGTLGRLAAFYEKVPVTVHTFHGHIFHSYFQPLKSKIFLSIERYLAERTNSIVAISDLQKNELSSRFKLCDPDKIHVIPLGFDLSKFQENILQKRTQFRKQYFLEDDEIAVGIIGRLVPVKNHSLFLNAVASLSGSTSKKVRWFIIGDGEDRNKLLKQAEHLNLDFTFFLSDSRKASLTFCSWIHDIDIAISGLDIITLTSFNEGTPVSLVEAQAGNKPIVATNVGGIENVVIPGKTAILVENNNLAAFVDSLKQIIEDDELRNQLSTSGWMQVKEKFHYSRLVKEMGSMYQQLLSESN